MLIRTRGYVRALQLTAASAGDGMRIGFGIAKATEAAIAAGIASVPTPLTEQDWDGWLFWTKLTVASVTATIADGVNAAAVQHRVEIDSKAMRKVPEDEGLYAAVEAVETGTVTVRIAHDSRMLFKLP